MVFSEDNGGKFKLIPEMSHLYLSKEMPVHFYTLFWATEGEVMLTIDNVPLRLTQNQMTFFTPNQYAHITQNKGDFIVLQFNRSFYCIADNDYEVSCNGLIFYGSKGLPVIDLDEHFLKRFQVLYGILLEEFSWRDSIQGEMLRSLLKRWIVLATRLYKMQQVSLSYNDPGIELIRHFNMLVEAHFRAQHSVAFYAQQLNRSPKTLAHVFKQNNQMSPLGVIHNRIVLEGKRLLMHSEKSVSEIAFELGFESLSGFSRLFKREAMVTPSQFRSLVYKPTKAIGKN